MTSSDSTPRSPPRVPTGSAPTDGSAGGDWFFDELMTPQPDATQAYFRDRLKALAGAPAQPPAPPADGGDPDPA
jgi:hypothetical protein